jgi:Putative Ig domain
VTGTLPAGLAITRTRSGEAILSGVPAATSAGLHPITVTVTNPLGKATGHYALTVGEAPAITSKASVYAVHGAAFSFTVRTSGYPHPSLTHTALPRGLKWANNNGTATISGTPTATAVGAHRITITAKNAYDTVRQVLRITVS